MLPSLRIRIPQTRKRNTNSKTPSPNAPIVYVADTISRDSSSSQLSTDLKNHFKDLFPKTIDTCQHKQS